MWFGFEEFWKLLKSDVIEFWKCYLVDIIKVIGKLYFILFVGYIGEK